LYTHKSNHHCLPLDAFSDTLFNLTLPTSTGTEGSKFPQNIGFVLQQNSATIQKTLT